MDLAKIKIGIPPVEGAFGEVTKDELEGAPVIKLEFPEGDVEAWRGSLRYELLAPADGGNYTLIFSAKSEPSECYIEVRVWDFTTSQANLLFAGKGFKLTSDWNEFSYDFTIPSGHKGPGTVTWGNLARAGRTISVRDVRIVKN